MRLILLAVVQSVLLCSGQVFLKFALQKMGAFAWKGSFFLAQLTNWWWLACGAAYGTGAVLWMYILKHYPFSRAYPRCAPDHGRVLFRGAMMNDK